MSPLFDTHCHLGSLPNSTELIERSLLAGVGALCLIATDEASIRSSQALANQAGPGTPKMFWSAGLHPHQAKEDSIALRQFIESAAQNAQAIGETGLDFYYDFSDREAQRQSLDFHIELACRLQKPLVLHCRQAADELLGQLQNHSQLLNHPRPGIFHCFAETDEVAKKALDLGFMISFSGMLTFRNADPLREVARWIPEDRILIETDSPYLAPVPHRGKNNEPAFLSATFNTLTALRPERTREQWAEQLWHNSHFVFGVQL